MPAIFPIFTSISSLSRWAFIRIHGSRLGNEELNEFLGQSSTIWIPGRWDQQSEDDSQKWSELHPPKPSLWSYHEHLPSRHEGHEKTWCSPRNNWVTRILIATQKDHQESNSASCKWWTMICKLIHENIIRKFSLLHQVQVAMCIYEYFAICGIFKAQLVNSSWKGESFRTQLK